jgi:hypothetical protein
MITLDSDDSDSLDPGPIDGAGLHWNGTVIDAKHELVSIAKVNGHVSSTPGA